MANALVGADVLGAADLRRLFEILFDDALNYGDVNYVNNVLSVLSTRPWDPDPEFARVLHEAQARAEEAGRARRFGATIISLVSLRAACRNFSSPDAILAAGTRSSADAQGEEARLRVVIGGLVAGSPEVKRAFVEEVSGARLANGLGPIGEAEIAAWLNGLNLAELRVATNLVKGVFDRRIRTMEELASNYSAIRERIEATARLQEVSQKIKALGDELVSLNANREAGLQPDSDQNKLAAAIQKHKAMQQQVDELRALVRAAGVALRDKEATQANLKEELAGLFAKADASAGQATDTTYNLVLVEWRALHPAPANQDPRETVEGLAYLTSRLTYYIEQRLGGADARVTGVMELSRAFSDARAVAGEQVHVRSVLLGMLRQFVVDDGVAVDGFASSSPTVFAARETYSRLHQDEDRDAVVIAILDMPKAAFDVGVAAGKEALRLFTKAQSDSLAKLETIHKGLSSDAVALRIAQLQSDDTGRRLRETRTSLSVMARSYTQYLLPANVRTDHQASGPLAASRPLLVGLLRDGPRPLDDYQAAQVAALFAEDRAAWDVERKELADMRAKLLPLLNKLEQTASALRLAFLAHQDQESSYDSPANVVERYNLALLGFVSTFRKAKAAVEATVELLDRAEDTAELEALAGHLVTRELVLLRSASDSPQSRLVGWARDALGDLEDTLGLVYTSLENWRQGLVDGGAPQGEPELAELGRHLATLGHIRADVGGARLGLVDVKNEMERRADARSREADAMRRQQYAAEVQRLVYQQAIGEKGREVAQNNALSASLGASIAGLPVEDPRVAPINARRLALAQRVAQLDVEVLALQAAIGQLANVARPPAVAAAIPAAGGVPRVLLVSRAAVDGRVGTMVAKVDDVSGRMVRLIGKVDGKVAAELAAVEKHGRAMLNLSVTTEGAVAVLVRSGGRADPDTVFSEVGAPPTPSFAAQLVRGVASLLVYVKYRQRADFGRETQWLALLDKFETTVFVALSATIFYGTSKAVTDPAASSTGGTVMTELAKLDGMAPGAVNTAANINLVDTALRADTKEGARSAPATDEAEMRRAAATVAEFIGDVNKLWRAVNRDLLSREIAKNQTQLAVAAANNLVANVSSRQDGFSVRQRSLAADAAVLGVAYAAMRADRDAWAGLAAALAQHAYAAAGSLSEVEGAWDSYAGAMRQLSEAAGRAAGVEVVRPEVLRRMETLVKTQKEEAGGLSTDFATAVNAVLLSFSDAFSDADLARLGLRQAPAPVGPSLAYPSRYCAELIRRAVRELPEAADETYVDRMARCLAATGAIPLPTLFDVEAARDRAVQMVTGLQDPDPVDVAEFLTQASAAVSPAGGAVMSTGFAVVNEVLARLRRVQPSKMPKAALAVSITESVTAEIALLRLGVAQPSIRDPVAIGVSLAFAVRYKSAARLTPGREQTVAGSWTLAAEAAERCAEAELNERVRQEVVFNATTRLVALNDAADANDATTIANVSAAVKAARAAWTSSGARLIRERAGTSATGLMTSGLSGAALDRAVLSCLSSDARYVVDAWEPAAESVLSKADLAAEGVALAAAAALQSQQLVAARRAEEDAKQMSRRATVLVEEQRLLAALISATKDIFSELVTTEAAVRKNTIAGYKTFGEIRASLLGVGEEAATKYETELKEAFDAAVANHAALEGLAARLLDSPGPLPIATRERELVAGERATSLSAAEIRRALTLVRESEKALADATDAKKVAAMLKGLVGKTESALMVVQAAANKQVNQLVGALMGVFGEMEANGLPLLNTLVQLSGFPRLQVVGALAGYQERLSEVAREQAKGNNWVLSLASRKPLPLPKLIESSLLLEIFQQLNRRAGSGVGGGLRVSEELLGPGLQGTTQALLTSDPVHPLELLSRLLRTAAGYTQAQARLLFDVDLVNSLIAGEVLPDPDAAGQVAPPPAGPAPASGSDSEEDDESKQDERPEDASPEARALRIRFNRAGALKDWKSWPDWVHTLRAEVDPASDQADQDALRVAQAAATTGLCGVFMGLEAALYALLTEAGQAAFFGTLGLMRSRPEYQRAHLATLLASPTLHTAMALCVGMQFGLANTMRRSRMPVTRENSRVLETRLAAVHLALRVRIRPVERHRQALGDAQRELDLYLANTPLYE